MQSKALILAALISGWSAPLMAASLSGEAGAHIATTASIKSKLDKPAVPPIGPTLVPIAAPDLPGDILGARGPDPYMRELNRLAIYTATGNTDGAEMLAAELSQAGVSREAMQSAIDWIMVHGHFSNAPAAPMTNDQHAESAWEATQ
jgi:alkylhydroperoxidase/carboxymuconolactone decarboxylase family protein YurZ